MSAAGVRPGDAQPGSGENTQVLGNIVIPPCPRIVLAMVEEAHSDEPDFIKLDKLISGDMGLASAVIKTANSPYYGLNHKVLAVKTALHILGLGSVTNIVTLLALRNTLANPGQPADPFWDHFWDRTNYHAIACGRLARQLRQLNDARSAGDMNMPGWKLHPLVGELADHWSITVNGNWRVTFTFEGEDAILVDYQDYH